MNQQQDIKEVIKLEYLKCAQDPAHFLSKYCQIQHPTRGRVHFQLYPFQDKVLSLFKSNTSRSISFPIMKKTLELAERFLFKTASQLPDL